MLIQAEAAAIKGVVNTGGKGRGTKHFSASVAPNIALAVAVRSPWPERDTWLFRVIEGSNLGVNISSARNVHIFVADGACTAKGWGFVNIYYVDICKI